MIKWLQTTTMRYQKPYVYAITVEYDLLTETKQWHIGLIFSFTF